MIGLVGSQKLLEEKEEERIIWHRRFVIILKSMEMWIKSISKVGDGLNRLDEAMAAAEQFAYLAISNKK